MLGNYKPGVKKLFHYKYGRRLVLQLTPGM